MNESTQHLGEVFEKTISEIQNNQEIIPVEINTDDESEDFESNIRAPPNSSIYSQLMRETLDSLLRRKNSFKTQQNDSVQARILGIPIQAVGSDSLKLRETVYEPTPEIHKILSSSGYTGKSMKKESDILMIIKLKNDLGNRGVGDKSS